MVTQRLPQRLRPAGPQRLGRQQIAAGDFHDPVRQPPSTIHVGRWRREMDPRDVRLFQRVAGSLLVQLGYQVTDPGPMSAGEHLRLGLLATKYATLQSGRHVLQTLGLVPPI